MSIVYYAKASIVNESATQIERLAAKIVKVASTDHGFIKTFPYPDFRNRAVLHLIKNDIPPNKKISYVGISFVSYNCINYIELYSTFNAFDLGKGDETELHFEGGQILKFKFTGNSSLYGAARRNVHPISDTELEFIADNKLLFWKIFNSETGNALTGGFLYQEDNKQYKSENTGRQLLKTMAKEILAVKSVLH